MFLRDVKADSTDVSVVVRIIDSADGTPELGVLFNTSGIDLQYRREGAANVPITEATLAALTTAHADGGFLEIGNGYYRLDLPDAAIAAGVNGVLVHGIVTGMVVMGVYLQIRTQLVSDVYSRIGAPAGASVSADIAAIEAQTDDIGTAGAGLTALPISPANVTQWEGVDASDTSANWETNPFPSAACTAASTTTSIVLDGFTAPDDRLIDSMVYIESGTGMYQSAIITDNDYESGPNTNTLTLDRTLVTAPDATSVARIFPAAGAAAKALLVATAAILADTGTDGVVVAAASKTGYALSAAGVDAILDEAITEPGGVFTWPATLRSIVGWVGAQSRNKRTQTATTHSLRNDADSGNVATSTVSDDGTTLNVGEWT